MDFKNYSSKLSISLPLTFLVIFNCSDLLLESNSDQSFKPDYTMTWEFINDVYPYLDLKNVDWVAVNEKYEPRAAQAKGDERLALLEEMLGELRDGHVYLKTAGGHKIQPYTPKRRIQDQYSYSQLLVRSYFDEDLIVNGRGGLEYGISTDNIGYIYIASFGSALGFVGSFQGAMNHVRSTDGLIIDVRHNQGGDGINANYVVSRFIEQPQYGLNSFILGEPADSSVIEPSDEWRYSNPVVVLINGVCYSATESFAEMMKQVSSATVVGDTTGGGSAGYYGYTFPASGNLTLSDGIEVHVGTMDIRRYDDRPFEDIGIPPDVLIAQSKSDIDRGQDLQLEKALTILTP